MFEPASGLHAGLLVRLRGSRQSRRLGPLPRRVRYPGRHFRLLLPRSTLLHPVQSAFLTHV